MDAKVHAPELDGGLAWLNVDRPLSLRELRGSVVVLDFWTYCCINCMHVLPTLRAIEARHKNDPVVVIGVHSGKFAAEGDPERIREAIDRYGVEHPVVADDDMSIWSRYGIRSWPTLVVIRPDGTIAAIAPGEPDLEVLDAFIGRELNHARNAGILAPAPPRIGLSPARPHDPLKYPGKVVALPDGRLAISDSGHHRILLCEPRGAVIASAGSGLRGHRDGPLADAAFDDPQGTAWFDGALYVADTRNHCLRRIDFDAGRVATVAGTGALGRATPVGRAPASEVALRSPWDVCAAADALIVAMAGSHQLWRFFPKSGEIELWAGTGVEAMDDGPRDVSAWAQPSGLAERDGTLFVADSETSAVRAVDLATGDVRTLAGQGLFDFGDDDGAATEALLQHPLGVAAIRGGVLVADTYNGKLKRLKLGPDGLGARVDTVVTGLSEPGSIAVTADGRWIVADTNAHRVLVLGPVPEGAPPVDASKAEVLAVAGAPEAQRGALPTTRTSQPPPPGVTDGWFTALLELPAGVGLAPGGGEVALVVETASGTELSDTAPVRVDLEVSRRSDLLRLTAASVSLPPASGPSRRISIAVDVTELPSDVVEAEIVASIAYVTCDARDHAACVPGRMHTRVPVRLLRDGGHALELRVPLPAPSV